MGTIEQEFATLKAAGMKVVLRFSYASVNPGSSPYGDATKEKMLHHLEQLRGILMANSDLILTLQAGLIGTWGTFVYE